jgi:RNA polymerase sigma-70 factor (ECF subfamily)
VKLKAADDEETSEASSAAITAIIPALRSYAMGRLRSKSNADDAVQETIERAWRSRNSFTPGAELKPWIFTILRNAIIDGFRRDRFLVQDVDGSEAARLTSEPDQVWRLRYAEVVAALESLSADQKRAIMLVVLGSTTVEAAVQMGCPLGTLKSHLRLGRRKLKAAGL